MRRALAGCLIACGIAAAPAAGAISTPSRATLTGFVCERAPDPLDRALAVTAVMRPAPGTQRMAMRFVLLRRPSGGSFSPLPGRDLGRWLTPNPATLGQRPTDTWKLDKLVVNLTAPAAYRFRVTFRWTGASGAVLGRTTLQSPICVQRG